MPTQLTVRLPDDLNRALKATSRRLQRQSADIRRWALREFLVSPPAGVPWPITACWTPAHSLHCSTGISAITKRVRDSSSPGRERSSARRRFSRRRVTCLAGLRAAAAPASGANIVSGRPCPGATNDSRQARAHTMTRWTLSDRRLLIASGTRCPHRPPPGMWAHPRRRAR